MGEEIVLELSRIVREAEKAVERRQKEQQLGELFYNLEGDKEWMKEKQLGMNCL